MAHERFKTRGGFILASVGAAIGLGDSLRFPGLCAKYGGGTFLFIYVIALVLIGIPVLNAEIALGRKFRGGAPQCMANLSRRAEKFGWASCFNSLVVAFLYAAILGWIAVMLLKIAPLCKAAQTAPQAQISGYFFEKVLGAGAVSPLVLGCITAAWVVMYLCLRGGAKSLAASAKFTVIIPVVLLAFLAGRGLIYDNSGQALRALFVPDFSAFGNAELWLNALGQVFFSLSVMVGIMPAYGAYLPDGTCIFRDALIIASADFFVSILSSVVLFTTLYGCGLQEAVSQSGIATAFAVYPVAITLCFGTENVVLNSITGVLFYSSLAMMALQSSVSMVEAVIGPLSEKFKAGKKKLAAAVCAVGAAVCIVFSTPYAATALDLCDHFANYFNILLLGIAESVFIGIKAKKINLASEINRYCGKMKMPQKFFVFSIKYLCPVSLSVLFAWGVYHLIFIERGLYSGYPLWAQAVFGWAVSLLVFSSGFIIGFLFRKRAPRPAYAR